MTFDTGDRVKPAGEPDLPGPIVRAGTVQDWRNDERFTLVLWDHDERPVTVQTHHLRPCRSR